MLRAVLRVCCGAYVAAILALAIIAQYRHWSFSDRQFVLASLAVAAAALVVPWLFRRRLAWTAVIAAVILQIDLGNGYRVDFSGAGVPTTGPAFCRYPRELPSLRQQNLLLPKMDSDLLTKLEYSTAVGEIQTRIGQEQTLFLIQLALAALVLGALYGLLHTSRSSTDSSQPDRNDAPAVKRHAVQSLGNWVFAYAFFWAAVLISAIIDARIRFNSRMMETLGCWVYLVESRSGQFFWESYLRADQVFFQPPMYELLRAFPSFITILLFTGIVYFSLVLDDEEPKAMSRWCASGTLALFCCTGASYHSESKWWLLHCLGWLAVGTVGLLRGSRSLLPAGIQFPARSAGARSVRS
jgi:hypothetical protein